MSPLDISMRIQRQTFSIKPPAFCGVYFLFRNGTLIYIGMSSNIAARLGAHATGKSRGALCSEGESLVYDEALYFKCDSWEEAKGLEKFYIKEMQPELNISHTRRHGQTYEHTRRSTTFLRREFGSDDEEKFYRGVAPLEQIPDGGSLGRYSLGLSVRAKKCLWHSGIRTVGDLRLASADRLHALHRLPGVGNKTIREILTARKIVSGNVPTKY